eukprot:scaffold938_cov334-Pavlova_lutheri.AAC.38
MTCGERTDCAKSADLQCVHIERGLGRRAGHTHGALGKSSRDEVLHDAVLWKFQPADKLDHAADADDFLIEAPIPYPSQDDRLQIRIPT